MRNRNNYRVKVYVVITMLGCVSLLALGSLSKKIWSPVKKNVKAEQAVTSIVYDEKVLGKLKIVCNKLDMSGKEFFISGSISSDDGADSIQKIVDADYVLSRKDQNYYCRFGNTETINTPEMYLFVDHGIRKIMVSASKRITTSSNLPDLSSLVKNLRGENYEVIDEVTGDTEHISLVNENHITCMLYKLSFNAKNLRPERIYLKLRDGQEPDNKLMNKTLEIKIKECGQYSDDKKYNTNHILKRNGSAWETSPVCKGYELIIL
ncbi:MAG TPA: hypothetical protein VK541_15585 [Pedobacter sp.]|uniref:hypothetical protein n=1 Tax=Pedobacter sp. TaxID=1411316 RepID=UPI002B8DFFAF|nr:hypothetical protein [Pedobacter sp.]HMI03907.1 hypothetical protein [Pedobacter sp.]